MTLVTPARRPSRFRASRAVAAMALLGLLAAAAGAPRGPVHAVGLARLVRTESARRRAARHPEQRIQQQPRALPDRRGGPHRLLMQESYGYSVLDLSNPVAPTALLYHDIRYPLGGTNSVTHARRRAERRLHDCRVGGRAARGVLARVARRRRSRPSSEATTPATASPCGAISLPTGRSARSSSTSGAGTSRTRSPRRPGDGRRRHDAADRLAPGQQPRGLRRDHDWPGGGQASLAGNYILYMSGDSGSRSSTRRIRDPSEASRPTIRRRRSRAPISAAARSSTYSAAVDPADATKLWVLVELNAQTGENSPSYGLLYVTSSLAKVSAGPIWRVPSQAGESVVRTRG